MQHSNLVGIAGFAVRRDGKAFEEFVDERLAESSIPLYQMRAMSKSFDRYLAGVLGKFHAPQAAIVQALGAFEPAPPDYAPAVVELARRLAIGSMHARQLPRWADLICFERIVRESEPSATLVRRLGVADVPKVAHAGRLVASFLKGQGALPEVLASALGPSLEWWTGQTTRTARNRWWETSFVCLRLRPPRIAPTRRRHQTGFSHRLAKTERSLERGLPTGFPPVVRVPLCCSLSATST